MGGVQCNWVSRSRSDNARPNCSLVPRAEEPVAEDVSGWIHAVCRRRSEAASSKELKQRVSPDLVFTHNGKDAHQDHRLISELTWNTFRNHLILEYEIPKYDGDMGQPSVFVPLDMEMYQKKGSLSSMDSLSVAALETVVSAGDISLSHAVTRDGVQCPQRLCRSFLLPQASDVN